MAAVTVYSVIAGLAGVAGGWCTLLFALSRERVDQLTAMGAGVLLGSALFSMLPHAVQDEGGAIYAVMVGYLGLFAIRTLTTPGAGAPAGDDPRSGRRHGTAPGPEAAWAAAAGLLVHSFIDGGALGVAVYADGRLGLVALLAMFLHKLPEGFSLAALMLAATGSRRTAGAAVALLGLATVAGAWSALLWARAAALPHGALIGLAAGSFLYVGATDMTPALVRKRHVAWLVPVGTALVYVLAAAGGAVPHGP